MRILHAATMKEKSSGIINQMKWEHDAALDLKLPWTVKLFVPKDFQCINDSEIFERSTKNSGESSNLDFRREYFKWLLSQEKFFDCFILRYNNFDFHQLMFIKKIKKPVYLVHHTLELLELKSGNTMKSKVQYMLELLIGKYSIKAAKCNVCVTNEIYEHENSRVSYMLKNKIIYPNGILYENNFEIIDKREKIPEIVFIASYFYEWHGLDLLLDDLKNNQEEFKLHIIGILNDQDRVLAEKDHRVILHGHLNKDQIQEVLEKSWIGLGSFSLYRKEMNEACTLKAREYLKNGLPIYSGHKDVFPEDFIFYKYGEPKFSLILDYCSEMREYGRNQVSNESKTYISKAELLENLYYNICGNVL